MSPKSSSILISVFRLRIRTTVSQRALHQSSAFQARCLSHSPRLVPVVTSRHRVSILPRAYTLLKSTPSRNCSTMAPASTLDRDILPDNVKPVNYDISLHDLELGGAFSYHGTVSILSKILKSSKEITLNAHQLKIHSAEIQLEHTKTQQSIKSTDVSYDAPRQRATISFPEDLPVSDKALLVIKFEGTINHDMAGFYRSKYKS